MHPTDRIENLRLFYYIAPSNRSEVAAAPVVENTEYVELITRGGVFYGDQYHGPGTMFWHFPGDMTIHRYKQESPYECLAALFTIKGPHKRIAPPVILWNAQRELQKFVDESLRAFHDDSYDRELLAYTVHARLLSAAYNAARIQPPTGTPKLLEQAFMDFSTADIALVLGSSLTVNPAASLPLYTLRGGGRVAIVNQQDTPLDKYADWKFADLQKCFEALQNLI